jgi:virginiamycin A acetyltransferase
LCRGEITPVVNDKITIYPIGIYISIDNLAGRMGFIDTVEGAVIAIASATGYPSPLRQIISASPLNASLRVGRETDIARGAYVRGDIILNRGATIAAQAKIRGNVTLKRHSRIGRGCNINADLTVGPWTNLVRDDHVVGNVNIGGYGAIGPRIAFREQNHNTSQASMQMRFYSEVIDEPLGMVSDGPIHIKNDVWIGADVNVLSGVTIGNGAIVGAGAVVTKDVEPYEIVAGVPATHRGWRFDEQTRQQLLDIAWWNWDERRIKRNKQFFTASLREQTDLYSLIE